jgi:hypothetical protein
MLTMLVSRVAMKAPRQAVKRIKPRRGSGSAGLAAVDGLPYRRLIGHHPEKRSVK